MKQKAKTTPHPTAVLLFLSYLMILCYLLFFSAEYGRTMEGGTYRYNLELFHEMKRFWNHRDILGFKNVIINLLGNILAFAPFGFFLPMFGRTEKNVFVCTVLSALFSFGVESIQLLTKVGVFDVDDIFLNAVGGFLGCLVYYFIWKPLTAKKIVVKQHTNKGNE